MELADTGIGVTAVLPGLVHTELSAGARAAHFHAAFTDVDPQARVAYHRRIAGPATMQSAEEPGNRT